MATRGLILTPTTDIDDVKDITEDMQFNCIESNSDSFPENMAKHMKEIMKQHPVEFIMAGGCFQSVKPKYEPNPLGFHDGENPQMDVVVVYNRDCGYNEKNELKLITLKERKGIYADYVYLINKGEIYCDSNLNDELHFVLASEYQEEEEED